MDISLRPNGSLRHKTRSAEPEDAVLLDRVRAGDRGAYGVLFERHHLTARAFARGLVSNGSDADDVVGEVFAATLTALEHGKGPVGSFLPYLMRSVRNESYRLNRRRRREPADCHDAVETGPPAGQRDPFVGVDEGSVVRVAFRSLPTHLREVLWRTEVDDATPTEIAEHRSATPHAVAMMALRGRQALGSAYLREHLVAESVQRDVNPACRDARPHLADFVRGSVGKRRSRRLAAHLETCAACNAARESLGRLNEQLRLIPFVPFGLDHAGASSLGVNAKITAWLTSAPAHVAACGMIATSVLIPTVYGIQSYTGGDLVVIEGPEEAAPGVVIGDPHVVDRRSSKPDKPDLPDPIEDAVVVDSPPATSASAHDAPGQQGTEVNEVVTPSQDGPLVEPQGAEASDSDENASARNRGRRPAVAPVHKGDGGDGDSGDSDLGNDDDRPDLAADDGDDDHGDEGDPGSSSGGDHDNETPGDDGDDDNEDPGGGGDDDNEDPGSSGDDDNEDPGSSGDDDNEGPGGGGDDDNEGPGNSGDDDNGSGTGNGGPGSGSGGDDDGEGDDDSDGGDGEGDDDSDGGDGDDRE